MTVLFVTRNKLRSDITFDAASFVVGQSISGTLKLRVLEPVNLRSLRLTYTIVEQLRKMSKPEARVGALHEDSRILNDRKAHEAHIFVVGSAQPGHYPFMPGEYTFPFSFPVPATSAPTLGLTRLTALGKRAFGALVQHAIRVEGNIASALLNYHEAFPVRVVNACPASRYCTASAVTVGQQAPAHNLMAVSPAIARAFSSSTYAAEQAEFRLSLPRPMVSLANDGFVPFRVAGLIPCRYEVRLHRTCTVQIKKRAKTFDSVVASTVMPALPQHGIAEGSIPLDASRLLGLTNLTGQRLASVQHHVSIHLLYDRGVFVDVDDKLRAKVPVVLVPSLYGSKGAPSVHPSPAVAAAADPHTSLLSAKLQPTTSYGSVQHAEPVMGQVLEASPCCAA